MKKILFSLMAIALVVGLVGAGAFALFDDTETSEDNTFTAGTLDLAPTSHFVEGSYSGVATNYEVTAGGDGVNGKVVFGGTGAANPVGIVPGDSGTITWSLTNTGSVDGLLTLTSDFTFTGEGINEPECLDEPGPGVWTPGGSPPCSVTDTNGDLAAEMKVWLTLNVNNAGAGDLYGNSGTYAALSGLEAALDAEVNEDMNASDTYVYVLSWEIPTTVNNIIQSDKVEIDITFTLIQG